MRVPDIGLDLVRCFVTVVESGGFTQASKRLHLTQSAITQQRSARSHHRRRSEVNDRQHDGRGDRNGVVERDEFLVEIHQ
jgi:hypothetical protein